MTTHVSYLGVISLGPTLGKVGVGNYLVGGEGGGVPWVDERLSVLSRGAGARVWTGLGPESVCGAEGPAGGLCAQSSYEGQRPPTKDLSRHQSANK